MSPAEGRSFLSWPRGLERPGSVSALRYGEIRPSARRALHLAPLRELIGLAALRDLPALLGLSALLTRQTSAIPDQPNRAIRPARLIRSCNDA
jgi:hypothetical protein